MLKSNVNFHRLIEFELFPIEDVILTMEDFIVSPTNRNELHYTPHYTPAEKVRSSSR